MIGLALGLGGLMTGKRSNKDYPSAFFNGLDFRLATYTGGPTYVPDHLSVLRSPEANLPAVQGMRLATTVADGAVLGQEMVINGAFDGGSGWSILSPSWTIVDGSAILSPTSNYGATIRQNIGYVANTTIQLIADVKVLTGSIEFWISNDSSLSYMILKATTSGTYTLTASRGGTSGTLYIRTLSAGSSGRVDNISVREIIPIYINTDESGNAILASTPQKTVTYNTDWTAKTFAETFDKFDISDPLKAPGWLCEPVKTNYALNSATPVTHTTGALAVGTYTLWQEGTGSIVATAGTAVGTFGTASNGAPATITIATAGTVVLTASGINTWVQLELGAFETSRIYTTTAPVTRAATVASFPTAGKIPVNNFAIRMIVVPRASGQSSAYCFGTCIDSNNYTAIIINPTSVTIRKRVSGISNDASVSITHASGVPLDLILYSSSISGMQIAVRSFSSSWGAFTDGSANSATAAKANAPIAATYQLGALAGSNQFTGNISSAFECVPIPSGITDPMTWAKTHWGVA